MCEHDGHVYVVYGVHAYEKHVSCETWIPTVLKVHLEGGVNRCKANLMTNNAELKTKCNTLSVTKECSRIPSKGLWTISSKFL